MDKLLEAISSGVVPLLTSAAALIIPAAAAYVVAWLKGRTALQEQAVRSAVAHVDALSKPAIELSGHAAKQVAMKLVTEQLGAKVPKAEKLSAQIERAVAERRESRP